MGLGAFTSVVGDAGCTIARASEIAITTGNSLTAAVTLATGRRALRMMWDAALSDSRVMVVGATGSIGAACARLAAEEAGEVVLIAPRREKLDRLKDRILSQVPRARVLTGTRDTDFLGGCDVVLTATSAIAQRVIDIERCKPGAVVCDVAVPPDVSRSESELRPDVLVVSSGRVSVPGDVSVGYDIGLSGKTVYACLAETMLLALEGRFEDFTLGRDLDIDKVKEIFRLFEKHGFEVADLTSFGHTVTDTDLQNKREFAKALQAMNPPYRGK